MDTNVSLFVFARNICCILSIDHFLSALNVPRFVQHGNKTFVERSQTFGCDL